MNIIELEQELRVRNIREDAYSLTGIAYDERLVISKLQNGKWQIYYSERGLKTGLSEYNNEGDACNAYLALILADPSTRKP